MRAIRPLQDVVVVSRSRSGAARLADAATAAGLAGRVGTPEDVRTSADLVCTCTTSAMSVFDGRSSHPAGM